MAMILSQAAYQHNVCFWHKVDMAITLSNVRFWGKAHITVI
jgi:hypothetical protein